MIRTIRTTAALFCSLALIGLLGLTACGDDDGVGPDPNAPDAPTNVTTQVSGSTVTVTWDPPSGADAQRVELSHASEETRTREVDGTAAETTFDGLTEGETYSAQVFASNSAGDSPGSDIVLVTISESVVHVNGDVLESTTWTSDKTYVLNGPVFVGVDCGANGSDPDCEAVTLTIEPGTTILGNTDPPQGARGSYLVVSRGSRLVADANADRPDPEVRPNPEDVIVFTSSAPRGQRARGDWGGLVLNGAAPLNTGAEAEGEGDSGLYGGPDEQDDSGILRGVRVEFAGDDVTATDQLNGIAFQGVGAGTTVDYVQVHYNTDDGTEPFGGTVSQTHMVMTGVGDDSFDGTDGWRGFLQFGIAQQRGDDADQGFEFSTEGDDPGGASPRSTAVVANVTLVGAGVDLGSGEIAALGDESDVGVLQREGSNFRIYNTIVTGFGASGFDVEGAVSAQNADNRLGGSTDPDATLSLESSIVWSNVALGDADENFTDASGDGYSLQENRTFFEEAAFDNLLADPLLPDAAFDIGSRESPPNLVPTGTPAGYTAFDPATLNDGPGLVMPTDGRILRTTSYAGALEPGTALQDAWYYGWTVWSVDGSDSRPNHEGL